MFFTLTNLRALIIDADDFCTRPQVLTEIINTLDLVIKVVLVTRRNRVSPNLQSRTTCPMDILEHLDFKNLLKRAVTDLKVPPATTVFLCTSTNTLELAKELLLGTVVFVKQPLNACIAELKAAGAAAVTPVLLVYHPYALKPRPDNSSQNCTECGERLGFAFERSYIYFQCLGYTSDQHSKLTFNQAVNDRLHNFYWSLSTKNRTSQNTFWQHSCWA